MTHRSPAPHTPDAPGDGLKRNNVRQRRGISSRRGRQRNDNYLQPRNVRGMSWGAPFASVGDRDYNRALQSNLRARASADDPGHPDNLEERAKTPKTWPITCARKRRWIVKGCAACSEINCAACSRRCGRRTRSTGVAWPTFPSIPPPTRLRVCPSLRVRTSSRINTTIRPMARILPSRQVNTEGCIRRRAAAGIPYAGWTRWNRGTGGRDVGGLFIARPG